MKCDIKFCENKVKSKGMCKECKSMRSWERRAHNEDVLRGASKLVLIPGAKWQIARRANDAVKQS